MVKDDSIKTFLFLLIVVIMPTSFFAQNIDLNQSTIVQNKYAATLPYTFSKGKILVDVQIKGETFKFMVDTGAPFAISEKIQNILKPKVLQSVNVTDSNGKAEKMSIVHVPEFQLGGITFRNLQGMVLTKSSQEILNCLNIDGIIGSNMLRNSVLHLDGRQRIVMIADDIKRVSIKTNVYQSMELSKSQSNPYIIIVIENGDSKSADKLLFDSGADSFYQMSKGARNLFLSRKSAIDLATGKGSFNWGLHGIAESQEQHLLRIPKLTLNETEFKNVIVSTTSTEESRIGSDILHFGNVTIDYKKKRFYFDAFSDADRTELSEMPWEVIPTVNGNKVVVGFVWGQNASPEIKLGDEVLGSGDLKFDDKDFCSLVLTSEKLSGKTAELRIRDSATKEVKTVQIKRLGMN